MDRLLRAEIVAEVRQAQMELAEMYREEWVTADRLSERLGMWRRWWKVRRCTPRAGPIRCTRYNGC